MMAHLREVVLLICALLLSLAIQGEGQTCPGYGNSYVTAIKRFASPVKGTPFVVLSGSSQIRCQASCNIRCKCLSWTFQPFGAKCNLYTSGLQFKLGPHSVVYGQRQEFVPAGRCAGLSNTYVVTPKPKLTAVQAAASQSRTLTRRGCEENCNKDCNCEAYVFTAGNCALYTGEVTFKAGASNSTYGLRYSCAILFGQCGGRLWKGPDCCVRGTVCKPQYLNGTLNRFYSQCLKP